jgi:hypothetical protein
MPHPRYIIAYTPPPVSPLARFGAGVLGYDCFHGVDVPHAAAGDLEPAVLRLMTVEARRFGFHASFMTPFCLAEGSRDELEAELARFASSQCVVPVGPLAVALDGRRVALQPVTPPAALAGLAAACRATFASFCDAATSGGVADVPASFRLSLTLAESVTGSAPQAVASALTAAFAPLAQDQLELDAITLLREEGARFRVAERWRLTGR